MVSISPWFSTCLTVIFVANSVNETQGSEAENDKRKLISFELRLRFRGCID